MKGAILLVKCDFSYSCAAADKISSFARAKQLCLTDLNSPQIAGICSRVEYLSSGRQNVAVLRTLHNSGLAYSGNALVSINAEPG